MTPKTEIHTGSHCLQDPGPGGYAAIIRSGTQVQQIAGRDTRATPLRAAMIAVLEALKIVPQGTDATIHTSSSEMVQAITEGCTHKWTAKGWLPSAGNYFGQNFGLWMEIIKLCEHRTTHWVQVMGTDQNHDTISCNRTAKEQAKRAKLDLQEIQAHTNR